MNKRKTLTLPRVSKNCPEQRLELSTPDWRRRCTTMLAFCCACHIGTVAILVGYFLR